MHTIDAARLERASLGPVGRAYDMQPPPELGRRLLEQIAAGAIWAGPTGWARDTTVRDTAGNYFNPRHRATANAVFDMLTDWLGSNAVAYVEGTVYASPDVPDGLFLVELRGPGQALLADLWEIPEEAPQ